MSCRVVRKRLLDHLEGRLLPGPAEKIRQHLESCERCREIGRGWEEMGAILKALGRSQAPAGFKEGVLRRVAAGQRPAVSRQWVAGGFASGYRRWAAVGGALMLVALVWFGTRWVLRPPAGREGSREIDVPAGTMAEARNEMDEFVDFCLEQHSQFVSQRALSDEGSLGVVRGASARLRRPGPTPGRWGSAAAPPSSGQGRQWWWAK